MSRVCTTRKSVNHNLGNMGDSVRVTDYGLRITLNLLTFPKICYTIFKTNYNPNLQIFIRIYKYTNLQIIRQIRIFVY